MNSARGSWLSRYSIRTKLIIFLATFALVMVATILTAVLRHENDEYRAAADQRATDIIQALAVQATPALLNYDYYMLERIAADATRMRALSYVVIFNKEGELAAASGQPAPHALDWQDEAGVGPHQLTDSQTLELSFPVRLEDGSQWGTIRLGLDMRPAIAEIAAVQGDVLSIGACVLLLGMVATIWLGGYLTQPIRRLHARTAEFALACPGTPPDADGDELESLSKQFDWMSVRLAEERRQRGEVNASLERLVEERTADLAASEARFRGLFENVRDAVYTTDHEDRIRLINRAGAELFGLPQAELLGRSMAELYVDPAERVRLHDELGRRGFAEDFECRLVRAPDSPGDDSEVRQAVESCVRSLDRDRRQCTEGIIRDLTTKRQLQEQLAHSQKLETVGTLAGGVAHDFNNILTGVLAAAQLIRCTNTEPDIERLARTVEEQALRGAELTKRMLDFARRNVLQTQCIDLNTLVTETAAFVRRTLDRAIELRTEVGTGPLAVVADPNQLEQVIVNLTVNARDAVGRGGRIEIRTSALTVDAEYASTRHALSPGHYVALVVADDGTGIPPRILPRIFEPFFTTKDHGKGTGLGLSVVYGIVKEHGGHIEVESGPATGTRITVLLPAATAAVDDLPERAPARPRGCESILVVDDQEQVRELVAEVLRAHGYEVATACDGREGLEALARGDHSGVLIDMSMPVMGGQEMHQRMRALGFTTPVVVMSGYAQGRGIEETLAAGAVGFLRKPFSMADLTRAVREALDRDGADSLTGQQLEPALSTAS